MAAIFLINSEGDSLPVHASISDSRSYSSKITQKPIEDGSAISDTKILENTKFTIEGIVSNTPIVIAGDSDVTITKNSTGFLSSVAQFFNNLSTEDEKIRVNEVQGVTPVLTANKFLKELYLTNDLISIEIYGIMTEEINNLLVKNLRINFNSESGDSLHFTLELEQIKTVSSQTTKIPKNKAESKTSPKINNGNEKPKEVNKDSLLYSFFN